MTIEAITSIESEVIALQTIFLCHGVGYEIGRKMSTTIAGCNEKALVSRESEPAMSACIKRIPC